MSTLDTVVTTAATMQSQASKKAEYRIKTISIKPGLASGRVSAYISPESSTKYVIQRRLNLAGKSLWIRKKSFKDISSVEEYLAAK